MFYAVIHWTLAQCMGALYKEALKRPAQALQLSFSTLTTIGYGTNAPDDGISTAVAMLQSFTRFTLDQRYPRLRDLTNCLSPRRPRSWPGRGEIPQ
jgi:hypothetical protein